MKERATDNDGGFRDMKVDWYLDNAFSLFFNKPSLASCPLLQFCIGLVSIEDLSQDMRVNEALHLLAQM